MRQPQILIDKLLIVWICVGYITFAHGQLPACIIEARSTGQINCKNVDLRGLNANTFDSISFKISSINLQNCTISDLRFLRSTYFSNKGDVRTLTLHRVTNLVQAHIEDIGYLSRTLQDLTISEIDNLQSINLLKEKNWNALENLSVRSCGLIGTVDKQLFENTDKVKSYDFSYNKLTSLDFSSHIGVTNVQNIFAKNNLLLKVTLHKFRNLQNLDLAENELSDMSFLMELLQVNSALKTIDLSGNKIRQLQIREAKNDDVIPARLDSLNLQKNSITTLTPLGSSMVMNVVALDLSGNTNLLLEQNTLKNLRYLQELKLGGSGLDVITNQLQELGSLQFLELQNNQLVDMSAECFKGTNSLKKLQLQSNSLTQLPFLYTTDEAAQLGQLDYLDISLNQLEDLRNFVAAPKLRTLRMNGSRDKNMFTKLSGCPEFALPSTLEVVCALQVPANDCNYVTFLRLLKKENVLYNHKLCCEDPNHECCNEKLSYCTSNYPANVEKCPASEEVCRTVPIKPSPDRENNSTSVMGTTHKERKPFENLFDEEKLVIAFGYVLAFIFLVMLVILCLRRYRTYEGWTKDHHATEDLKDQITRSPLSVRSNEDFVDGPTTSKGSWIENNNPKTATLSKSPQFAKKSMDTLSIASGASHYSTLNKNAFSGRNKFKDAAAMEMDERYTPQREMKKSQSLDSAEDSPTTLSVYSYASHQPERLRKSSESTPPVERRRHRSGGSIPARVFVDHRSRSEDLLDTASVDSDLLPPKILLERKATLNDEPGSPGTIVRNARSHASAPHRTKGKGRKKGASPLLTVKQVYRNPGAPTPPMSRRALPAPPNDSPLSIRSHGSTSGGKTPISLKKQSVFSMDDDEYDNGFVTVDESVGYR